MTNYEKVSKKVYEVLNKAGFANKFSTFDRPDRLIVEARSDSREGILKILKANFDNVIENDSFAGGNRIAIKVPNLWGETKDSKTKDSKIKDNKIKDKLSKSYWYGNGKYQKEYELLYKNGIKIPHSYIYYRMYNDGDYPSGIPGVTSVYAKSDWNYFERNPKFRNEHVEAAYDRVYKHVEEFMDKEIITLYNKYKNQLKDTKTKDSLKTFKVNGKIVKAKDEFDAIKKYRNENKK